MKVTPLDIRRKEFKRSMRGYADEEVDIFLDEVADEFERLYQENAEMQDRLQRLEEQLASHAQLKAALEKTLVSAQLQADQMTANARKESELIMRDAELKARDIVSESYSETQKVQQTLVQLKHLEEDFRFKFRSLLEAHLKLLNDAPIAVQGAEAVLAPALKNDAATLTPAEVRDGQPVSSSGPGPADTPSASAGGIDPESRRESGVPEAQGLDARSAETSDLTEPPGAAAEPEQQTFAPRPERTVINRRARPGEEAPPQQEEPAIGTGGYAGPSSVWPTEEPEDSGLLSAAGAASAAAADEDVPTQETEAPIPVSSSVYAEYREADQEPVAGEASQARRDAGTETPGAYAEAAEPEAQPKAETYGDDSEERPVRGFFFGRQVDYLDDSFVTSETQKSDKGRDFEW